MMPKEETLDYNNEDKEIHMIMNNAIKPDVDEDEIDISEPGPSGRKKVKTDETTDSPVQEIVTISSDGFVSLNNTSSNPSKSKKRKQLRHTINEFQSAEALRARKNEEERLKRLQEQRSNNV